MGSGVEIQLVQAECVHPLQLINEGFEALFSLLLIGIAQVDEVTVMG